MKREREKALSIILALCFMITMLCSCSGSTSEVEEEAIDKSEAAAYIDSDHFTVDTETLLQSIEKYLSTSDAQLKYEREPGSADLFVIWPMDVDNDIESRIHFYKNDPDDPDSSSEDITDTSEIPGGMKIQYDIYVNGDSPFDSTDRAAKATALIMRAIGFTDEEIPDDKLYKLAFDSIDYASGNAKVGGDAGNSHGEEGNADVTAGAIKHNKQAKVVTLTIKPKLSEKELEQRDSDTFTFGSYEQDNDTSNGKEPIEWIVLDEAEGKKLILSKVALDCKRYLEEADYNEFAECVWSNSSIRNWLNEDFINEAFNEDEQKKICETNVVTENNEKYGTSGGADSTDKVFLLSYQELFKYYPHSTTCKPSAYADEQGSFVSSDEDDTKGNTYWFLRTPGSDQTMVQYVTPDGTAFWDISVDRKSSIRPAMWIEME